VRPADLSINRTPAGQFRKYIHHPPRSKRRQSRQATNTWSGKDADHRVRSIAGPSVGRPCTGGVPSRKRNRAHRASDRVVDAATEAPMFFGTTQGDMAGMNGAIFPQPALVWLAMDHSLSIRALKENRRPAADTKLCVAPYWNVYDTGSVCLGSMRAPMPPPSPPLPSGNRASMRASLRTATWGGSRDMVAALKALEGTRR